MQHVLLINSDKMEPIRILLADPEVRLSVITKPKYAHLYHDALDVWPVDDVADLMQSRMAFRSILRRHPVDAIVTPIERSVLTGGFLRSYFTLPGLGYDESLAVAHKVAMKKLFRHNALLTTDFESLPCLEHVPAVGERLGWPIIVKPAIGSGTMHTHRIDSADHFHALQAAHKLAGLEQVDTPLLAERFVPVEMEYHCDALVHEGNVVFASVSRIIDASLTPGSCFILGTMGDFCGSQILPEGHPARQPVLDLNSRVIKALGLSEGVTHLEVLYANGSFFVGEIAVRPGGGGVLEAIRLHYGIDLWQAYIDSALGRAPKLAVKRDEGITGWYGLPARNGSIRSATPLEVLRSMPGVIDVKMFYQPGDTVQEKLTSVFYIGILYFHFDHESELMSLNKALRGQYHLEIEDGPVSQQVAV